VTSQTTAVHHLLQRISVLAIAIQLSKTSCWLGELEARRRLGDSTPTRFACQDLAVSHLRFLLSSHVSRTAQARSLRRFYHNFEGLSSPRSQDLTTTLNSCQDLTVSRFSVRRLETARASRLAQVVYHSLEPLSRPRSLTFLSASFGETAKASRFDPESLPQFQTVVKPLQYHVCESSRFSRSICGLGREARFPLGICSLPQPERVVKTSRSAVFQSAVCRFGKPRRLSLSTQ
jgi:hypothetical protein